MWVARRGHCRGSVLQKNREVVLVTRVSPVGSWGCLGDPVHPCWQFMKPVLHALPYPGRPRPGPGSESCVRGHFPGHFPRLRVA